MSRYVAELEAAADELAGADTPRDRALALSQLIGVRFGQPRDYVAELRELAGPEPAPTLRPLDWRAHPYQAHPRWYEWAAIGLEALAYISLVALVIAIVVGLGGLE